MFGLRWRVLSGSASLFAVSSGPDEQRKSALNSPWISTRQLFLPPSRGDCEANRKACGFEFRSTFRTFLRSFALIRVPAVVSESDFVYGV